MPCDFGDRLTAKKLGGNGSQRKKTYSCNQHTNKKTNILKTGLELASVWARTCVHRQTAGLEGVGGVAHSTEHRGDGGGAGGEGSVGQAHIVWCLHADGHAAEGVGEGGIGDGREAEVGDSAGGGGGAGSVPGEGAAAQQGGGDPDADGRPQGSGHADAKKGKKGTGGQLFFFKNNK